MDAFLKNVNPDEVNQLPSDDPEVKKAVAVNIVQASEELDGVAQIILY